MKIFNLIQNLFIGSILENEKDLENEKKRITKNLALVASCDQGSEWASGLYFIIINKKTRHTKYEKVDDISYYAVIMLKNNMLLLIT